MQKAMKRGEFLGRENGANDARASQFFAVLPLSSSAAVLALLLSGCAAPIVTTQSAGCSTLIPDTWLLGVSAAPLPDGNSVGDWIAFGDAQTGKLDQANSRTKDAIEIQRRCEARDAAAVKRATRGLFGRLFG